MALNAQQDVIQNAQLRKEIQGLGPRRYTTADRMDRIAKYYYLKTGKGITFSHLIREGISKTKPQSQNTLKRFRSRGVLFTLENRRPQIYYPTSMRSRIIESRLKNAQIDPTGVNIKAHTCNFDEIKNQTLVGYVLPLLPTIPLSIHNMHFKLHLNPERYNEITQCTYHKNGGKHYQQVITGYLVRIVIYPNGTLVIQISSSDNPFKLADDNDLARFFVFMGEIRGLIKGILNDPHDRFTPDVLQWQMTECDINKDIVISHAFHMTNMKIQLKHVNHLFRIYFKSMGMNTVCRVEENIVPKKPVIETIAKIFEFNDRFDSDKPNIHQIQMEGE